MKPGKKIAQVDWSSHIECNDAAGLAQCFPGTWDCLAIPVEHQRTLRSLMVSNGPCPYCAGPLSTEREAVESLATGVRYALVVCHACGFWRSDTQSSLLGWTFTVPYARSFQPAMQTPALSELARQVQTAPEKIYDLSPTQFEVLIGGVLAEFFDCEVEHVGRTGDGGIDLVVIDAEDPLLVQVKRRTRSDATEGVEVVKHLFASLFAAGRRRGMLVTSAQRFTRGAKAWARLPELRDNSFELELADLARVLEMTQAISTQGDPPWRLFTERMKAMKLDRSWPELECRVEGDDLLVTSPTAPETKYVFARADRDCCTVVEPKANALSSIQRSREGMTHRQVEGLDFIELVSSWPRSTKDQIFSFFAGPNDEMRVRFNP